jgi:hypothetical protein
MVRIVPHLYGQIGVDIGLTVMLMLLAYQLPRLAGAYALKRILGSVMTVKRLGHIMPKAGYLEWCAVASVPLISFAVIMIAKNSGGMVPVWLRLVGL